MKNEDIKEIIEVYDKYIKLLGEEIDELSSYLHHTGWKSSRVSRGMELRNRIFTLKQNLLNISSSKLLPCPICGSEGEIVIVQKTNEYFPNCSGKKKERYCLLNRSPVPEYDGFEYIEDAIDVWNSNIRMINHDKK